MDYAASCLTQHLLTHNTPSHATPEQGEGVEQITREQVDIDAQGGHGTTRGATAASLIQSEDLMEEPRNEDERTQSPPSPTHSVFGDASASVVGGDRGAE